MIVFEANCDNCGKGMLQDFLNSGYLLKMKSQDFIGKEMKCDHCEHSNKVEDSIVVIPGEFNVWSQKNTGKHRTDDSVSEFLNE